MRPGTRIGTGISLEELILSHVLGLPIETMAREDKATGVMMIPIPQAGVLESVGGLEAARRVAGVDDVTITIPVGQEVVPLPEGNKYLGFIFARGDSPEAVEAALRIPSLPTIPDQSRSRSRIALKDTCAAGSLSPS